MRIVLLTFESLFADFITAAVLSRCRHQIAGVVCSSAIVAGKSLLAGSLQVLRQGSAGYPLMKTKELAVTKAAIALGRLGIISAAPLSVREQCRRLHIPVVAVDDINAGEAVAHIRRLRPELLVSVYFNHRLGSQVLALPGIGTLNVHGAVLPRNRGLFPAFWAFSNGERELGSTVHWVDENFDTGDIVLQRGFQISDDDTAVSVQAKSAELGAELLVEAIERIASRTDSRFSQDETRATYNSWPHRSDIRRFHSRGRRYGSVREIWRLATDWGDSRAQRRSR